MLPKVVFEASNKKKDMFKRKMWYTWEKEKGIEVLVGEYGARET